MGIQPPKLSKFRILAINLCFRGDSFALFLSHSQVLYASIGNFEVFSLVAFGGKQRSYNHFPVVGTFSHKFSIAPRGETTDRIKKLGGTKTGRTSSITMPSMVGIVGRAPAVDENV